MFPDWTFPLPMFTDNMCVFCAIISSRRVLSKVAMVERVMEVLRKPVEFL